MHARCRSKWLKWMLALVQTSRFSTLDDMLISCLRVHSPSSAASVGTVQVYCLSISTSGSNLLLQPATGMSKHDMTPLPTMTLHQDLEPRPPLTGVSRAFRPRIPRKSPRESPGPLGPGVEKLSEKASKQSLSV